MSGVVIHDGWRIAHRKWCTDAIGSGIADGVILSPYSTPRISVPRHPSAREIAGDVRGMNGEVIFDATTHARFLPGVNRTDFYNAWELWGPDGASLQTAQQRLTHIDRVFRHQDLIGAPRLAPTIQLASPRAGDSYAALDLATIAKGLDAHCWQSLVGTRAFWSSGAALDAYVGSLAALRAPTWVLTVANEIVVDHTPNMVDVAAFAGLCRTIHSLSMRSRVILAHADYTGLVGIAAGADTVGSGWDRAQKTFDPTAFRVDSDPGIRIPASYVTQGTLNAVLRRDTAEAIERWSLQRAQVIRGGDMPPSDQTQRMHHLMQLRNAVAEIAATTQRAARISRLRERYRIATEVFDVLIGALSPVVKDQDKQTWASLPAAVLEAYAQEESP